MNREQLPRIRLKVATNGGINILCTALRTWKVSDWLPYIQQAYRQVKQDQEDDQDSRKRFIKALRIKKGNFLIANSQLIGDIFQDNDQVQCQILLEKGESTISKKEQKKNKIKEKQKLIEKNHHQEQILQKQEQINRQKSKKNKKSKNKKEFQQKNIKKDIQQPKQQQLLNPKHTNNNNHQKSQNNKSKSKNVQKPSILNKQKLLKGVDLAKLKSIISLSNTSSKVQSNKPSKQSKKYISSQQDQNIQQ